MANFYVILPAGGIGKRMNTSVPKQLLEYNGKPIFYYTLRRFYNISGVERIVIPVFEEGFRYFKDIIKDFNFDDRVDLVIGGRRRQDSVFNALSTISEDRDGFVLIHDIVRPFISQELILDIMERVQELKAVIPAIPVKDTIKIIDNGVVRNTPDRNLLFAVQTPQAFQIGILYDCLQKVNEANIDITDDAMALEYCNKKVYIVEGDEKNIKITTQSDLKYLKELDIV